MIQDELNRLDKLIKESTGLEPARKEELEALAKQLRIELDQLAETKLPYAKSISGHAKMAAFESLREDKDEELMELSISSLRKSIREFEVTHPNLTRIVQQICIAFGV